jgi:hypothetical protein
MKREDPISTFVFLFPSSEKWGVSQPWSAMAGSFARLSMCPLMTWPIQHLADAQWLKFFIFLGSFIYIDGDALRVSVVFFVKLMACLFVGRKKTTSPDSRRGHHVRTLGCNDGPRPMKPGKWWSKMAIGWNFVACFQTKSWFHWWDFGGYIMLNRLNKYQGSKHIRDLKYD